MAFFTAIGVISNDIVRRETKNGIVTTFRLETGAPRGRKLWIDVECWGHLAGTIAHHGETGRSVAVSGRLVEKVWRDQHLGTRKQRLMVAALDVDLLKCGGMHRVPPNIAAASGKLLPAAQARAVGSGTEIRGTLRIGRSSSKGGRLNLPVRIWSPKEQAPRIPIHLSATGQLCWDSDVNGLTLNCHIKATVDDVERLG